MKKFLIIFSLFFFSQVNALSITSEQTQNFYPSAWIVTASPIYVTVQNDNEITSSWFTLFLEENYNYRFYNDLTDIIVSWAWSWKILTSQIMPNLREIKFSVNDNFKTWDNLIISWIKVVIYSKPQGIKWISIDTNWDWIIDAYNPNWIRIYETYLYQDTLSPAEIFNLTGSLDNENNITLNADMPGDIDFQAVMIENLDFTNNIVSSYFKPSIDNFSYKLLDNIKNIRFRTVDFRANYSTWLVYSVDYFKKPQISDSNEEEQDGEVCIQVITYAKNPNTWECRAYSTPCDVPQWYQIVESCVSDQWDSIVEVKPYIPTFTKYKKTLNDFVALMDKYIRIKSWLNISLEKQNRIMLVRNEITKTLEDLDSSTKMQRPQIMAKLILLVSNLKQEIRN